MAGGVVEGSFLPTFQADEVLAQLREHGYRCEGCGAEAPPPGPGRRCAGCKLPLPIPEMAIDPDGGANVAPVAGRMHVVCGINRGLTWLVRRDTKLTIGRRSSSKLRLFDKSSSRDHAVIDAAGETPRLVDLGSRAGTFVNGHPVKQHHLRGGALIRIRRTVPP